MNGLTIMIDQLIDIAFTMVILKATKLFRNLGTPLLFSPTLDINL